ncbi:hypothetical protein EDM22_17365 [Agromyces tardus]|jgi:hypothetical protein|uniref:Uncharacterized protein n=1 Tax=Agromyces tardus TaxID=2583849 RepID=A0A3M8A240_9MICO|nr:hypothetical protein [Agromyces tardus]RNB44605.1 hypothetical protein EDM22_17365 [Agromyces tardus]
MDEVSGEGDELVGDDHEFQVAQDGEFVESDLPEDDDERVDDDEVDDVTGIDEERRVPGLDDPLGDVD